MKKQAYQAPAIITVELHPSSMLVDSEYVRSNMDGTTIGRGYGGVDEDGSKDPNSRRQRDLWDEEEE